MVGFLSDGRLADHAHERGRDARERGRTHLAAWTVREALEDAADPPLLGVAASQEVAPELVVLALGRRSSRSWPTARPRR